MNKFKRKIISLIFVMANIIMLMIPTASYAEAKKRVHTGYLFSPSTFSIAGFATEETGTSSNRKNIIKAAKIKGFFKNWEDTDSIEYCTDTTTGCNPYDFPGPSAAEFEELPSDQDFRMAKYITEHLPDQINQAIAFDRENKDPFDGETPSESDIIAYINNVVAAAADGNGAISDKKGPSVRFEKATASNLPEGITLEGLTSSEELTGLEYEDLRILTNSKGKKIVLIYAMPKGYHDGQFASKTFLERWSGGERLQPEKITWYMIARYASKVYNNYGWTSPTNVSEVLGQDESSGWLGNIINGIASSAYGLLGLYDLNDLILNSGTRASAYYYGVMPNGWFANLRIFYWISTVIAAFIMTLSIGKMIIKKEKSIVSPGERYALMDGVMNYIYAFALLLLFPLFFYIILNINATIVGFFRDLVGPRNLVSGLTTGSSLTGAILAVIILLITLKINIEYIIRAITVSVCYVMGPAMISSITFTGRQRSLMSVWLKELLVNLFLQSFNAIILAFYISVMSSQKFFISFVLAYSFIPMNKWFKNNLLGQSGVGGDAAADATSKSVASGFESAKRIGEQALGTAGGIAMASALGASERSAALNTIAAERAAAQEGGGANGDSKEMSAKYRDSDKGLAGSPNQQAHSSNALSKLSQKDRSKIEKQIEGKTPEQIKALADKQSKFAAATLGTAAAMKYMKGDLRGGGMLRNQAKEASNASLAYDRTTQAIEQERFAEQQAKESAQKEAARVEQERREVFSNEVSSKGALHDANLLNEDGSSSNRRLSDMASGDTGTVSQRLENFNKDKMNYVNEKMGNEVVKMDGNGNFYQNVKVTKGTNGMYQTGNTFDGKKVQAAMEADGYQKLSPSQSTNKSNSRGRQQPSGQGSSQRPQGGEQRRPSRGRSNNTSKGGSTRRRK